ncbi:MAG TPA: acetate/propionate family kinase [Gammaproteobacteria bacterium]|nr:acetate/propionate family kinase [Gammaproteobacteria bacterium]
MEARPSLLLALNAGGSSLKAKLYSLDDLTLRLETSARLDGIGRRVARLRIDDVGVSVGAISDHARAAEVLLDRLLPGAAAAANRLVAVGHRIVHGGAQFAAPVRITSDVARQLDSLSELAPLHNPPALTVVRTAALRYPRVPAYAVFDTTFFLSLPPHAREYALPAEWRYGRGIRRFGFHGLAHECMTRHARQLPGGVRRLVTLQLGHGCSAAAVLDGRPVETSMGFSPLEGLIMATRPGDLDAGVLLELGRRGEAWSTIGHVLNRESGLKGLSGTSGDVRELLELEAHGHEGATLALAAFHHRILKYLGAYAAVLGGLDAIAIGGGIGENAPIVRARICRGLEWLGVELDSAANDDAVGVASRITTARSSIAVDVVPVDEELLIAERVRDSLPVAAQADDSAARSAS